MTELQAIDVSNYQGPSVDWGAVARSGVALAITKCSEGTDYADPTFARNWSGIKAASLVRGAYHFARPDHTAPEDEAHAFLGAVGQMGPGDFPVLDIEVGTGDLSAWCLVWLLRVEAALRVKPWVYTGGWFAAGRLTDPALGQYPLWNSAYTAVMPPAYKPWSLVSMWQYTESASIPGIPGRCDASWFLGGIAALAKLGKPGPVSAPPAASWPTGPAYVVAVPDGPGMYLRIAPRLDAPHADFVPNGEVLQASSALQPNWTTSWRAVARTHGTSGYAYAGNLKLP